MPVEYVARVSSNPLSEGGIVDKSFARLGGWAAVLVGVLSIAYAVFFLAIQPQSPFIGAFGSWSILAASGVFSSAAYVALYQRVKGSGEDGYALWALLLGIAAAFVTLTHGVYQALLVNALRTAEAPARAAIEAARLLPSQVDPAGVATFGVVGLVSFLFSWRIAHNATLPRNLGVLGMANAILLIVLFVATALSIQPLILLSGGLTSVIAGPIWWIWLGRLLMAQGSAQ
ncbi:MAG: hypothetical protein HZB53_20490 [Chloroflexi bacterium]|nr:hypothetical protein [Chloroflexota bacterium]